MTGYRFGLEVEVSQGAADVLSHLYNGGHVGSDHLHAYHCGKGWGSCSDCDPGRSGPDWTGQEDCTADGEFVSRILTLGPEGDRALEVMADALVKGRADQNSRVGMHVHADAEPFADDPDALVRLWRLWLAYEGDVGILARGAARQVRGYNSPNDIIGVLGYRRSEADVAAFFDADHGEAFDMLDEWVKSGPRTGRWLSGGLDAGTFEFRLWNGARSLWRIRLAVYVSIAFARAALDGVEARPDDGRCLLEVIGDYLPDDVYASVFTQLDAHDL